MGEEGQLTDGWKREGLALLLMTYATEEIFSTLHLVGFCALSPIPLILLVLVAQENMLLIPRTRCRLVEGTHLSEFFVYSNCYFVTFLVFTIILSPFLHLFFSFLHSFIAVEILKC